MYKFDGRYKPTSEIPHILEMGGDLQIGQNGKNGDRLWRKEGKALIWLRGENGAKRFLQACKVSKMNALDPREPQQMVKVIGDFSYGELQRAGQIISSEMNLRDQI